MGQGKRLTVRQEFRILSKNRSGESLEAIAKSLGCCTRTVSRVLGEYHEVPNHYVPDYLPSEAEIMAATAEIRKGWSEEEHQRRADAVPVPYRVPEVEVLPIDRETVEHLSYETLGVA